MRVPNLIVLLVAVLCAFSLAQSVSIATEHGTHAAAHVPRLPLRFEANAGQWDSRVRFVAHDHGATFFQTDEGMTLALRDSNGQQAVVTMTLVGSQPNVPIGQEELSTKSNFYLGGDPSRWRSNVYNFGRTLARDARPGVDVTWHGGDGGIEYDLVVAAGVDAAALEMEIDGAEVAAQADGAIAIVTTAGTLVQKPPRVVQSGRELRTRCRVEGGHRIAFDIEGYDLGRAILIDPTLVYSTYVGGSNYDYVNNGSIAVDSSGNVIGTGYTASTNFPLVNQVQSTFGGGSDTVVTKLNASGSALIYSTYLGGAGTENGCGMAIDASDNAYVTGYASINYPTTVGAYQTTFAGGGTDAVVTKLSPSGALVYSTYFGANSNDLGYAIAVDGSGNAYVAGASGGGTFMTTPGAFQSTPGGSADAFVMKLDPAGSTVLYSTLIGGTTADQAFSIAIDGSGNAYVCGETAGNYRIVGGSYQTVYGGAIDAFVTKVNPTGTALVYSTYLGGNKFDGSERIRLDSSNAAYIVGRTDSANFPATVGALQTTLHGSDAYAAKLNPAGTALVYATYLGGTGAASKAWDLALDSSNDAYVVGATSGTFPTTVGALKTTYGGGANDGFLAKLDPTASTLLYSTYLGGTGDDAASSFALDANGDWYVAGYSSGSFPTTVGAVQTTFGGGTSDTFFMKIGGTGVPLAVNPTSANVPPLGAQSFGASGGSGSGYTYTLQTNASGGSINSSSGAYQAGTTGNVTDVVKVTDSLANTATANVTVGPGVSISPGSPSSPPKGGIAFSASGGSGTGFTWSLTTNASGGAINPTTGAYTAGAVGSVVDTVSVVDSLGNTASTTVSVGAVVAISPSAPTTPPLGGVSFSASGGSGTGWVWSISVDNSGGTINAGSGAYTAGATGGVTDTVHVVDSLGNVANTIVTVGNGVVISPPTPTTPPKGAIGFTASGGSGAGYAWSVQTNASGGTINASSGAYVAGPTGNVNDVVKVVDSLGSASTVSVVVGPGVTISPSAPSAPPKGTIAFAASGGSNAGFTWSIKTNASGGSINASSGAYAAGSKELSVDTVAVVDSLGNGAEVNVSVGGGLAIDPASPSTPPRGSIAFIVVGGSGGGYAWSLATNASGGSIDGVTGAYVAGSTGNVTDVVRAVDSLANTATVSVTVGSSVTVTPRTAGVAPNDSIAFAASGGSGKGYAWSLVTNASGGSVDAATGAYVAGRTPGEDVVRVVDSLGNADSATVTVSSPTTPPPPSGCDCQMTGGSTGGGYFALVVAAALLGCRTRRARRSHTIVKSSMGGPP